MSARRLTPDQERIVRTLDRPLFVAAGAGSGKSSTLAERVAWALAPGSGEDGEPYLESLDQALIITFTHAAAEEIREKIRARLREGGLTDEALQVDSAWISTIHGMCSRILRAHALDLGLDPNFKLVRETAQQQMLGRSTDAVMRDIRDNGRYPELRRLFKLRSDGSNGDSASTVFGMASKLRDAAASAAGGFDSLKFAGTVPDFEGDLRRLSDVSAQVLAAGDEYFARRKNAKWDLERATLEESMRLIDAFLAEPPGRRTAQAAAELVPTVCAKPQDAFRSNAMKPLKPELAAAREDVRLSVSLAEAGPLADDLVEIAREVDARYRAEKAAEGVLDNDDLLALCLKAFREHPEIAREYGDKFRLVMVDEFQDTNQQQVEMVSLLSGEDACHLATVGDAQQSIYRFRGADVGVFEDRRALTDEDSLVTLQTNFRSHAEILSFVDQVFDYGLIPNFMSLEPCETRRDAYRARELPRVSLELTSGNYGTSDMRSLVAAEQMADRMADYLSAGQQPGDIALLLGRMRNVGAYLDALRARKIPCVVTGGSTFSAAPEVGVVSALLHFLANPHDTKDGLYPVLASDMFLLDADDLCLLSTKEQEMTGVPGKRGIEVGLLDFTFVDGAEPSSRLLRAREVLLRALGRMGTWDMGDVMRAVLRESGWLARLEGEGEQGRAIAANALAAVRYADELAREGGLGVSRAASEFSQWLKIAKKPPASLSGGDGGVVRVMTVHASKGLEFPVVGVAECWGSTRGPSVTGLTCENIGADVMCSLVVPDVPREAILRDVPEEPPVKGDRADWARYLVDHARSGELAEQARLLYVALTRAREALVVDVSFEVGKEKVTPPLAGEFLNMVCSSALDRGAGSRHARAGEPLDLGRLDEFPPGETSCSLFESELPVRVRRADVRKSKDGGMSIDAGGTLDLQGDLIVQDEDEANPGAEEAAPVAATPVAAALPVFDVDPADDLAQLADGAGAWRPREGVFSYSSAHEQMAGEWAARGGDEASGATSEADPAKAAPEGAEAGSVERRGQFHEPMPGQVMRRPVIVEQDLDDVEAAPVTDDADKATSLGSAFHELAQAMVETGGALAPARVDAVARYWFLSSRQRSRLDAALALWEGSSIRREALSHELVRAEVPFFQHVESEFGEWLEGAIDLLCTDAGSSEALVVDYKTGDHGLSSREIRERHAMQADFYAHVLLDEGFEHVTCVFVCVERDDGTGEPLQARYEFGT